MHSSTVYHSKEQKSCSLRISAQKELAAAYAGSLYRTAYTTVFSACVVKIKDSCQRHARVIMHHLFSLPGAKLRTHSVVRGNTLPVTVICVGEYVYTVCLYDERANLNG